MSSKADTIAVLKKVQILWTFLQLRRCFYLLPLVLALTRLLAFVLLFNLTVTRKSERNEHKSTARLIGDTATSWVSSHLSPVQLKYYFGTTARTYSAFLKQTGLPSVIDDLEEGGRLLWVGKKQTRNVILYCHGGGFLTCLGDFHLAFCHHVKSQLDAKDPEASVGVAVLEYSLAPASGFPTQLRQLSGAIAYLFSIGVQPQGLHLVGDSAGANLILQLLLHTLHPLPSNLVQPSPLANLSEKIRGACLMSPWTAVLGDFPSSTGNVRYEWVNRDVSIEFGRIVLEAVPEDLKIYVEVSKAPEDWFDGVEGIVERFFVSVGEKECLADPINAFVDRLRRSHPSILKVCQKNGVHNDVLQDFFVKEKKEGDIMVAIDGWLAEGVARSN